MTFTHFLMFITLIGVLSLFMWGRWRYDLVACFALIFCTVIGLIPFSEAFTGFGHPATITVAAVLIISRALTNTGATDIIARVIPLTKSPALHIGVLALIAMILSAFMNNIGALAVMMPITVESAAKSNRSPSLLLMPVSFASILGGLITQIGTPPNIIIANYREKAMGEAFSMFDFSFAGGSVALVGILFIVFVGWHFIPLHRRKQMVVQELFDIETYVTETRVGKDARVVGKLIGEIEEMTEDLDLAIVGLVRGYQRFFPIPRRVALKEKDVLIIEADPKEIDKFVTRLKLQVLGEDKEKSGFFSSSDLGLAEVVVTPGSTIDGRLAESLRLDQRFGVSLLAVSRQGRPYRGRLSKFRFRVGDVLLLYGSAERISELTSVLGCLPLAERGLQFGKRKHVGKAVLVFATLIMTAALGILPLPLALLMAAGIMVILNIVPLNEMYDSIDWPVIVLLAAMIPIGAAFDDTGAADLIVENLLNFAGNVSPVFALGVLMVLTMTLSDVLNNAATAILVAPIGVTLANRLGVNPDTFLMTIAISASCAFLTPIGHQNNALIMGPGGYKFGDYWRMGLPLEILIVAVGIPAILWVWPL